MKAPSALGSWSVITIVLNSWGSTALVMVNVWLLLPLCHIRAALPVQDLGEIEGEVYGVSPVSNGPACLTPLPRVALGGGYISGDPPYHVGWDAAFRLGEPRAEAGEQ